VANQIADFFAAYPRDEAIAGVADHLEKFWDLRMRTALISHAKSGGAGLRDLVRAAIHKVEAPPG
jgi:formate dehydrogenase subunit delta